MENPALLILVKNPIAGKTKTRLAASVGHARALEIYVELMRYTREASMGLTGVTKYLYYSQFVDDADDWSNSDFIKMVQVGSDLGVRMATALDRALARGHRGAVIIGSDCPKLSTAILAEAFDRLNDVDLVVGPAVDGGYYLLGLRHPQPYLFADMTWSTEDVRTVTLARAEQRGLRVHLLPVLSDVDRLEDWEREVEGKKNSL